MKIHNIRMGLATNSSSTHSLIFMSPESYEKTHTDEYGDFDWSFFTAADKESKENYLGFLIQLQLHALLGKSNGDVVLNSLFPHRQEFSSQLENAGYGVDHQSVFSLPTNWDGKGLDLEFASAFRDYIVNNPIAILGGNDNDNSEHPLSWSGKAINLGIPRDGQSNLVARNDGEHWVIFNRDTGAKIRLSFTSSDCTGVSVKKAAAPELVDIKITDYCPFGCPFCYQASTTEGTHADLSVIKQIIRSLAILKVFEVALGGGEPTLHPKFIEILEAFRYYNIVPNFTTKNLAWMNDDKKRDSILKNAGAFAYSVSTREDVQKLAELIEKYNVEPHRWRTSEKFSVQYVLSSGGDLYGVLDEARKHYIRVTLLGFKTTGFGKNFPTVPDDWITTVQKIRKENGYLNLGVDTAIIKTYGDKIRKKLGVKDELMTAEEGKFSMYIDAVGRRVGPSSYCEDDQYIQLDFLKWDDSESIQKAFMMW